MRWASGGNEGEAAGVRVGAALEAAGVHPGGGEAPVVGVAQFIVAEFAEEGCAQAEAGGVERGVGRGATGRPRRRVAEQADDAGHFLVVDQDHPALVPRDVAGEEVFGDLGKQVHNGGADTDEIEGGHRKAISR